MWCQSHVELWIVVVRLYLLKLGPKKLAWSRDCEECEPVAVQTALSASSGNWLKNTGKRPRFQTTCGALMRTHCFKTESWLILLITDFKKWRLMMSLPWQNARHVPQIAVIEQAGFILLRGKHVFMCYILPLSQAEIKIRMLLGSHSYGLTFNCSKTGHIEKSLVQGLAFVCLLVKAMVGFAC